MQQMTTVEERREERRGAGRRSNIEDASSPHPPTHLARAACACARPWKRSSCCAAPRVKDGRFKATQQATKALTAVPRSRGSRRFLHDEGPGTTRRPGPGTRRVHPWRIMVPNCGHRDDPGMTRLHLQGACGSEIGRPALHDVQPLRLAKNLEMHRMECPGVATEARGCACTRTLEAARGIVSRRSTFREGSRSSWRSC